MVKNVEQFYISLFNEVQKMKLSRVLTNPSGNLFTTPQTVSSAIMRDFGELNKIRVMCELKPLDFEEFVKNVRSPEMVQDKGKLILYLAKINKEYSDAKGEVLKKLSEKFERL